MNSASNGRRRVVITGMGAITPLGLNVEEFWQGLVAGKSGVGWITVVDTEPYPVKVAGEISGFDPDQYMSRKEARRMARFSQFTVAAAVQAFDSAGLEVDGVEPERLGVSLGNGYGGLPNTDQAVRTIVEKGGMRVDPFFMLKTLPNMAASHVSMRFHAKGHTSTITTACAAATQAIGEAAEVIRRGAADVMLAGAAEAGMCELGLASFTVMKALSTRHDDPTKASRPFDARRDGFVSSEGAAVFVLEGLEHAQARGASILAELIGFAASADAYHMVAPCVDGEGAARCIRWALEDAGVAPEEVDYINAHGTSTQLNDAAETMAIKTTLGEHAYQVPISSTKSMIGHTLGASGALESVACVKTLQTGVIHPTINYEYPDPNCDLDYVPEGARQADVRVILKNSFGFGGQNACLVFRRFEE
ncbi:MAG: beta-ketoacyl-ACP synthase II [Chloroflexi bacterium]|nr:beta-ketoacyl-ACP synthase II [Chloroflexota bacterium]